MESKAKTEDVALPEGIACRIDNGTVHIKGANGELSRRFPDRNVKLSIEGNKIVLNFRKYSKKEKKTSGTIRSHIKNMIKGITTGHTYALKICSGHFPMTVTHTGKELTVKNFLGERVARKMEVKGDVKIKIAGSDITIEGVNKELVSQCAASIEQLTRRANFDRRIFQDGIYLISKDGKPVK